MATTTSHPHRAGRARPAAQTAAAVARSLGAAAVVTAIVAWGLELVYMATGAWVPGAAALGTGAVLALGGLAAGLAARRKAGDRSGLELSLVAIGLMAPLWLLGLLALLFLYSMTH